MIKKLKHRFIWINLSILLTIFFTIFSSTYYLMYQSGKVQAIKVMEQIAQNEGIIIRAPFKDFNGPFKRNPVPINQTLMRSSFTLLLDSSNHLIKTILNMPEETNLSNPEQLVEQVLSSDKDTGIISFNDLKLRYLIHVRPNGSKLIVFLDRSTELATLSQLIVVLVAIGGVSIVILTIISYYLANWAIKPIALAWEKQQQFVADASHELKTPLTVIQTTTDILLSNKDHTIRSEQKWMDYIQSETERMSKLVSDLLYLTKVDNNESLIKSSSFNLSESITNVILPFESLIFESGKELQMNIEPNLMYTGEEARLQQVVVILLDNALKHAPIQTKIEINLHRIGAIYQLEISNEGEGISREHLHKIFERFYRVDSSRARETGGYGLGLAIAKSIIDQHQGKISVTSTVNGLTTFRVTLPTKPIHKRFKLY